jgi:murein DD-endopeptidase MepM/ murein hydrolase activator NlpD
MFVIGLIVLGFGQLAFATSYQLPVNAPITDAFRPPATPFGAGNRGWEFATDPGQAVTAAADGVVVFAGQVGGVLNVVIQHSDGLLTTYSKLQSIQVISGAKVGAGEMVGTASSDTYFGVRSGGQYIDPAGLFGSAPYLVADSADAPALPRTPDPAPAPATTQAEINWLQNGSPSAMLTMQAALSQIHF